MSSAAEFAPIAIFAYKRVEPLAKVLTTLEACPEFRRSPVFLFLDGPKSDADRAQIVAVRAMVRERLRDNMTLIEASSNQGIYRSIVDGVTRICNEFGRVIVIEDDVVVSPVTLAWLNQGLQSFADEPRVWQISAHQLPVPEFESRNEGVFLPLTTSWGWATWKRAWDRFDPTVGDWLTLGRDPETRRRFDLDFSYPYSELMEAQLSRPVRDWDWDVRFWWNVYSNDGVSLFPPRSLVVNIGFDESATHYRVGRFRRLFRREQKLSTETALPRIPERIAVKPADYTAMCAGLRLARTFLQRLPWLRSALRGIRLVPRGGH
jgi:hypothetical protein